MCSMTEWDEERLARAVLSHVCEPGDPRLARLVGGHGAPDAVAALRRSTEPSAWAMRARAVDEALLVRQAERVGVRFILPSDAEWPRGLAELDHCDAVAGLGGAPLGLWVRGEHPVGAWLGDAVAVVGARAATRYGEAVAADLAGRLSVAGQGGYTVVSGGAYGIDAAAHRGALASGGRTIGVYAGGLDEPYPRGNARLFEQLVADHVTISEIAPGVRPTRAGFLARNRLIAALCLGTVVVEAAQRSGARNTATWAGELGRTVMAVPGSVHSAMSIGCHRMIRDGQATLVTDSDDVCALLAPMGRAPILPTGGPARPLDFLDPELLTVREAMPGTRPVTTSELALMCGKRLPEVVAALVELEQLGLVRRQDDGSWRLKRPVRAARVDGGD